MKPTEFFGMYKSDAAYLEPAVYRRDSIVIAMNNPKGKKIAIIFYNNRYLGLVQDSSRYITNCGAVKTESVWRFLKDWKKQKKGIPGMTIFKDTLLWNKVKDFMLLRKI